MTKKLNNQDVYYCTECNERTVFDLEGNIKICTSCNTKSSYKYEFKQRWSKTNQNPDLTDVSPYNRKSDENVMDLYHEIIYGFRKLTTKEQTVVTLLWEGKTQHQIAVLMGIGQPRVAKYLDRARKKLTSIIGKSLQGD